MGHGIKDKHGRYVPITPWQGSWAQRMQDKDWPLGTPPKAAEPPPKKS